MYIYTFALEPAALTVFMVWLRAWLRVRLMRFGRKNTGKNQENTVERLVGFRGTVRFNDQRAALFCSSFQQFFTDTFLLTQFFFLLRSLGKWAFNSDYFLDSE